MDYLHIMYVIGIIALGLLFGFLTSHPWKDDNNRINKWDDPDA